MPSSKIITRNDLINILAHINLGDNAHKEVTQAEFDALTPAQKNDGSIYFITDGISGSVFLDDNTPVGMIAPYGGTTDPAYWLICDGRAVSRTTYAELFAVIGTTYGTGDGSTTFNIPDLRGNVAVGASATYDLGDTGGEIEHTLTIDEMPSHKHEVSYRLNVVAQGTAGMWYFDAGTVGTMTTDTPSVAKTGGSQAHNNMQPYVVTNYIIKTSSTTSNHQANIDFYYPVGSYYETSNVSFDPNITWGGTWILENAVDDYIVEEGMSGIWTYRKWASGIAELHGYYSATVAASTTNVSNYIQFPFTFTEKPDLTIGMYSGGTHLYDAWFESGSTNNNQIRLALYNGYTSQTSISVGIDATGFWKTYEASNTKYKWHRTT